MHLCIGSRLSSRPYCVGVNPHPSRPRRSLATFSNPRATHPPPFRRDHALLEAATVSSALLQDAVAMPGVTAPTRRHVHALKLVSRAQRYSTNQVSRDRSAHRKLLCSSALHVDICTRAVPICKPDRAKVTRPQHCAVLEQCVHSRLPPSDSPPTRPLQRYMYA
jgi:hypothetical protein